jgi:hypothetical protein
VPSPLTDAVAAVAREAVVDAGGVLDVAAARDAVLEVLGGGAFDDGTIVDLLDDALHSHIGPLETLPGDQVADVWTVGERLVLTHRLADHEVVGDRLDLDPDLAAMARLARLDGGLHTPDGARLRLREQRVRGAGRAGGILFTTHLEGPAGWLSAFAPGELVAARAQGGMLSLEPLAPGDVGPAPADVADVLGALMAVLHEGDGSPVWAEELQWASTAEHADWFEQPGPPFGDMVVDAGLEVDGRSVGLPGSWEPNEHLAQLIATIARNDLDPDDRDVLRDALDAFDAWVTPDAVRSTSSLRRRLHRQWAASLAFLDELRWRGVTGDQIDGFGDALGAGARGDETAIGLWLRSRGTAIAGRALDAEQLAHDAHTADGWFPPATDEAAWYAGDRGRAREAVNLLHRVREPDDSQVDMLRRYAQLGAPGVGRNDPCPCGSGRKFKQCHLGRAELPELDRVRWLLDKAREHLHKAAPIEVFDDLMRASDSDGGEGSDLVALDLLLFLDGWWTRFVDARGPLLTDWERGVGRAWADGGVLSVFRVDSVDAAGRRHLRDAVSGRVHVVEASPSFDGGQRERLVCCRLLPVDDRWFGSGVVRVVSLGERAGILEALCPPTTSMAVMAALFPPGDGPVLQNTSGDPLVICHASLRLTGDVDGDVLGERLDSALERDDDMVEPIWHLLRDTRGMDRAVIATVSAADGGVDIEANSVARRDELVDLLRGVLGDLTVVSETRTPMARERAAQAERDLVSSVKRTLGVEDDDADEDAVDDALDDEFEAAEVLDQYTHEQEHRWLDQPIPALGGSTPRAAAADDSLRPDLLTLLAETDERGLFDSDRLRAELGLAQP